MISFPKFPSCFICVIAVFAVLWSVPTAANVVVRYAEFSPDGSRLALNLGNETAILDIQTGDLFFISTGRFSVVKTLRFTPDSNAVLIGKSNKRTAIYRFPSKRPFAALPTDGIVTDVAFLSDGKRVLVGLWDGSLEIWDYRQERRLVQTEGHMFGEVQIDVSDDEKFVVSAGDDQTVRLWRLEDLKFIRYMKDGRYGIKSNKGMMRGVAFIDDGSAILTTGWLQYCLHANAKLLIFDISDGQLRRRFEGRNGCGARSLSVAANRELAAFIDRDRLSSPIVVFDVLSRTVRSVLKIVNGPPSAAALSPNGQIVASADLDIELNVPRIHFWSVDQQKRVASVSIGPKGIMKITVFGKISATTEVTVSASPKDLIRVLRTYNHAKQ